MTLITDLVLLVTLWATGIAVGAAVAGQPRRWPLGARATLLVLAVNVLVLPLAALVLVRASGVSAEVAIGVMLVAAGSGGPLGITTARVAGGDVRSAVALVVVLELLNLLTIPAWLAVTASGEVPVPIADVLRTLVVMLLAPTGVGWVLVRARPDLRARLVRTGGRLSVIGLVVVVALVVAASADQLIASLGTALPVVAVAMVGLSLAAGALAGGRDPATRRTLALVTAGHANALALGIARSAFADAPAVAGAVVVMGLAGVLLPVLAAAVVARIPATREAATRVHVPTP
jgi:BASS family bile acid:Na+ symporter